MFTWASALASVASLALKLWGWLTRREAIEEGVQKQDNADLSQEVKDATEANRIAAHVDGLSDSALNAELREHAAD